ncbi:MAG: hypothetical protein ACRDFS_10060 [Chloroflexota bacterium]
MFTRGLGAPDDLAVRNAAVFFSDEHTGAIGQVRGGKLRVIARHLRAPEGLIVREKSIVVVEQGRNRLLEISRRTHRRRVVLNFSNPYGRLGVDGIHPAPGGGIYIPDSPNGRLLLFISGRTKLLASGLGRPVDAISYRGGIAIADETADAVWFLRRGHLRRLATVSTPDDLAVVGASLLATALGDGSLWEIKPRVRRLATGYRDPQGLAVLGKHTVLVADSTLNEMYRVNLAACSL